MATFTLNPNAPIFVSSAYRAVENFSDHFDSGNTEQGETKTDLVTLGALKWQNPRVAANIPKYCQKAPKIVNVKVSPRPIQQPQ
nr:protein EARLY RESPONSIVE TO DEHYDRATION 15-like [Ipomoea trifida]